MSAAPPLTVIKHKANSGRRRKAKAYDNARHHQKAATSQRAQSPQLPPTSPTDHLCSELVRSLDLYNMSTTPAAFVPMYLGHSALLDAAAAVLVQLHRHSCLAQKSIIRHTPILRSYAKALTLASHSISSSTLSSREETLAGVTLLGTTGILIQMYDPSWSGAGNHKAGAHALLLGPQSRPLGQAARATLYASGLHTFAVPAYNGHDSPFESAYYLDADPPSLQAEPKERARLRRIAYQLFIRLPRLIRMVRTLRESCGGIANDELRAEAQALAAELEEMRDREAESWLLHRVRVVATTDAGSKRILPVSFEFAELADLDAGLCYWQTRLLLSRLRSRLLELEERRSHTGTSDRKPSQYYIDTLAKPVPDGSWPNATAAAALQTEELRLTSNILMSSQPALHHLPCSTSSLSLALIVAWNSLRLLPTYHGIPTPVTGAWLHKTFRYTWFGWIAETDIHTFTMMAGVLDGGALCEHMLEALNGKEAGRGVVEGHTVRLKSKAVKAEAG